MRLLEGVDNDEFIPALQTTVNPCKLMLDGLKST